MLLKLTEAAATIKNPYRRYIFLLVKLRTTETSKQTNILLIGSFQSPSSMAVVLCLFSRSRLRYVRVTDRLGIQTNMADKYRCQEILAPGNIEDYCESNLTFP